MRKHEEDDLQEHCVAYFRLQYNDIWQLLFAVPNGGRRSIREAVRLKRQGVVKGVPDLLLAIPSGDYHGLFIELKSAKGVVRPEQKEMMNLLAKSGYCVKVIRDFDVFRLTVKDYLKDYKRGY